VDDVQRFRALLEPAGQRLLELAGPYDPAAALSLSDRLRRTGATEDLVAMALTQARLRAKAAAKFGADAARMYFTDDGLQQATRPVVADRHAARFAGLGAAAMVDLCCGIGSDLLALARAGLRVTGVERDPLTASVGAANIEALGLGARAEVVVGDAEDVGVRGAAAVFVDPARRAARGQPARRTFHPAAYSPSFGAVLRLAATVPATGAKLAPGIPHGVLPPGAEAEWVSVGGDVVECALWFGPLATARRRATVLPSGATVTGTGDRRAETGPVRRFLHEPVGAVIRAGLVAEVADPLDATLLDPTIAYLSTDRAGASPFTAAYEVTDTLPFHLKRLRSLLRARGVGRLTVKKRGSAVTPEQLRAQLRLSGDGEATIVLTRVAGAPTVLVVEPVESH